MILDHWNPEFGSPGDDRSAQAADLAYDYVPGLEDGPEEPERDYREAEAQELLKEEADDDAL